MYLYGKILSCFMLKTQILWRNQLRSKYMTSLIFLKYFFFFFKFWGNVLFVELFTYIFSSYKLSESFWWCARKILLWMTLQFYNTIFFLLFSHLLTNLLNNFGTEWRFPRFSPKSRKIQTRPETAADFPILNGESFLMLFSSVRNSR